MRVERMADYARWVRANAEAAIRTAEATGGLPIPLEMRADQSLPDVRYSVGVRRAMRDIAGGRGRGIVHNPEYGDIDFPLGSFGRVTQNGNIRHGLGLLHIVFARMAKEGASLDDAVQTAIEVADAAESGVTTRDEKNRLWLGRNGVRAVVAKNADGKKVITGYEIYADEPKVTNRASFGSDDLPTPRSEDVKTLMAQARKRALERYREQIGLARDRRAHQKRCFSPRGASATRSGHGACGRFSTDSRDLPCYFI